MKKIFLVLLLTTININLYAQEQKKNSAEISIADAVISISVSLGVIILLILIRYFMTKSRSNAIRHFNKISELAKQRMISFREIMSYQDLAEKLNLREVAGLINLTTIIKINLLDEEDLTDLEKIDKLENFIAIFDRKENRMMLKVDLIKSRIKDFQETINFVNYIGPGEEYLREYDKYQNLKFEPIFDQQRSLARFDRYQMFYTKLINNHIAMRETLTNALESPTVDLTVLRNQISANIVNITRTQERLMHIIEEDTRKEVIAAKAKTTLRKKAEALLTYCDEPSCDEEVRERARESLTIILEEISQMPSDIVKNYEIFQKLNPRIDACMKPYLCAQQQKDVQTDTIHIT